MNCFDCGKELTPVMDVIPPHPDCSATHERVNTTQFDNALQVRFIGGYGEFFDNFPQSLHDVFFCEDCGIKLCQTYPKLYELFGRKPDFKLIK